MRELITMWKDTRMVVLTAITAGVYAAVLIPFKVFTIIPGFTELRPANAIPIVFSLMFGPAAAWGSAIGNFIGDCFGTLGLGSLFGFVGNFLYGYIPYRVWQALSKKEPGMAAEKRLRESLPAIFLTLFIYGAIVVSAVYIIHLAAAYNPNYKLLRNFVAGISVVMCPLVIITLYRMLEYILIVLLSSLICGVFIGWGVHTLGLVAFVLLGNIIIVNNFIMAISLGPPLLRALYPRVKRWGLLYRDVMSPEDRAAARFSKLGVAIVTIGGLSGLMVGNLIGFKLPGFGILTMGGQRMATPEIPLGLTPSIVIILISLLFL